MKGIAVNNPLMREKYASQQLDRHGTLRVYTRYRGWRVAITGADLRPTARTLEWLSDRYFDSAEFRDRRTLWPSLRT